MVAKAVVMTCASSAIMKDASAVTPSTQFFPPLTSESCIASLRLFRARVARRSSTRRTGNGKGCGPEIFSCDRILLGAPNVYRSTGNDLVSKPMEKMMKRTLIRYKTKPELADRNAELIAGVFQELKAAKPEGVRYLSLRSEEHTSELQSHHDLVCRLLLEKK